VTVYNDEEAEIDATGSWLKEEPWRIVNSGSEFGKRCAGCTDSYSATTEPLRKERGHLSNAVDI